MEQASVRNYLCETELNEQAKISLGDDSNQNNRNYSETISSQLHATFHSDSEINNKVRSLNLKKKINTDFKYN